jgi:phosphoglycerate dehydrogenase-like enzyme
VKPSAYFINIGRGKECGDRRSAGVLDQGEIADAGLDVTNPEPLPEGHQLWNMPNVIITPHSSSPSDRMTQRFWSLVWENL